MSAHYCSHLTKPGGRDCRERESFRYRELQTMVLREPDAHQREQEASVNEEE